LLLNIRENVITKCVSFVIFIILKGILLSLSVSLKIIILLDFFENSFVVLTVKLYQTLFITIKLCKPFESFIWV